MSRQPPKNFAVLDPARIALRTYVLTVAFALGPSLLPAVLALVRPGGSRGPAARPTALLRELGPSGIPFALTVAIGGGQYLRQLWISPADPPARPSSTLAGAGAGLRDALDASSRAASSRLTENQKTFLANAVASAVATALLQRRRRTRPSGGSPTIDLTLLLLVRAVDALVQSTLASWQTWEATRRSDDLVPCKEKSQRSVEKQARITAARLDALVFWACSARIMWCFFYQPQRLPASYVKWISKLARVDPRLVDLLRALRQGRWSYLHGSSDYAALACTLAADLGHPPAWGDLALLPAYGGRVADAAWQALGVRSRQGVGGLPCELVHGTAALGGSCTANAAVRAACAFAEALAIYLPLPFVPLLLTRPRALLSPAHVLPRVASALRSAAFLSAFVSSYWFTVCTTRTLVLARLFPTISHDTWDGPHGCVLAGSLACGVSILIENAKRRGEMALYVLPKALKASIPRKWTDLPGVGVVERMVFTLSMATLLTTGVHQPESLRGFARWALDFILKGSSGISTSTATHR